MKLRKMVALLVALVMVLSVFSGCSKKGGTDTANTSAGEKEETAGEKEETAGKKEETAETAETTGAKDEIVTLKWIQVGNKMPTNYEAWQKNINEYLGEKIGVNIDVEVVSWGDWNNRRSVIVNSGEYFDILFTDSTTYNNEVGVGAFLDITDLIKEQAPDLYKYIPEDYWNAVSVKGKIYSVPTYKDSSATQYFVWDKALADKYSVDYDNIHTLADATDSLKKIKDGEGTVPFLTDKRGVDMIYNQYYDAMGSGLVPLGVRYDDTSCKVVNVFEQKDVLERLDILHQWYKDGIINADAPTLDEAPYYRAFGIAQGWSTAAKTSWGPKMGVEAVAVQASDTIVSNQTVRGSLNGIYSGTKYPEKCIQFLQLVNLDSKVRDAFYYGLEGENFNYDENDKVVRINNDWAMAGYTQGTFFNVTQLAEDEINQWNEVKELNSKAKPSVLLGFNLDTSEIETEIANCRAVYEKYSSELVTGAKEPRALVEKINKELNDAGFEKIVAEAQTQVDAFNANK